MWCCDKKRASENPDIEHGMMCVRETAAERKERERLEASF